jgi:hypothetical protein
MELLLEPVAPAVAVAHGSVSFDWRAVGGANQGDPFLSGRQVGGAMEGCANNDNHQHPPFRAVSSARHTLHPAYVGERVCGVKAHRAQVH